MRLDPGVVREAESKAVGGRLNEVVQRGYPDVGWAGDPLLEVRFNGRLNRWEVVDTAFNPPVFVLSKPFDGLRDLDLIPGLCRRLASASFATHGADNIQRRMEEHNRRIDDTRRAARERETAEMVRELLLPAAKFDLRFQ